ncbi:hypothetical protein XU18_0193 [Perkinsela sp. CCAP 1560/4]|nr:hypothetical protein XU18_0193 [Perkinsela sp. CCAP 1560/4]|eukprot:KNH09508.1 hypothetical protein XU18_0193 [Perkinsela sp. CCAP 1560/4]
MLSPARLERCSQSPFDASGASFRKLRSTLMPPMPSGAPPETASPSSFSGAAMSPSHAPRTLPPHLSPYDPLGGAIHRDYTRTQHGYLQHSPRNMLDGGSLGTKHHLAPSNVDLTSVPVRTVHVAHMQAEISKLREASRHGLDPNEFTAGSRPDTTQKDFANLTPNTELWLKSRVQQGGKLVDTHFSSPVSKGYSSRESSIDPAVAVHRSSKDLHTYIQDSSNDAKNIMDRRSMHQLHGFRDKEEHEAAEQQKYVHQTFDGYAKKHADVGKAFFYVDQTNPAVPPANYQEATKALYGENQGNSGDKVPLMGADLSEHIIQKNDAMRRAECMKQEKERADEFGIGRQGPLVKDGGPDQRTFQRGKNDERYLTASSYYANAYKGGMFGGDPPHPSPYGRRRQLELQFSSEFDIDRRVYNIAQGEHDVYDRQHEWLGVPVKTQIEDRVRLRRGAFGERSIEFFKPFPTAKHLQLYSVGADVQGMPVLAQSRSRVSQEEWGLFLRYREHWYQRRNLAIRYNLEPTRSETISERNARREKLDNLCAATPFEDPYRSDIDLPSAASVRSWFGTSALPSPIKCPYRGHIDEPLLSIRHLRNKIIAEGQPHAQATHAFLKIPPFTPKYQIDPQTVKYLSAEQKERYEEYLCMETAKYHEKWKAILAQRKYISQLGCYAKLERPSASASTPKEDLRGRVSILLDNGKKTTIPKQFWESAPFEQDAPVPNQHLNWGIPNAQELPLCNLSNYTETQDTLWERRVYEGVEGWSYAAQHDAIQAGQVVMIMRSHCTEGQLTALQSPLVVGAWEKAIVTEYQSNDYYNPTTNLSLTAKALADGASVQVPLSRVLIWQKHWSFPGRCDSSTQETLRFSSGTRRFVDSADPKGAHQKGMSKPHFLDHLMVNAQPNVHPYQNVKQVTELDMWHRWDAIRPENYRRLTANDRKDYIVANYFHKFTPWDMICHQEDDQPLMFFDQHYICEQTGPSHFTNQNRFWTGKRRSVGCIRNSADEIRDYFRHVDGNVPWETAKRIQWSWENRVHNPLAMFHTPTLSPHRNKLTQLPLDMYEYDKKTGQVIGIKEGSPENQHV